MICKPSSSLRATLLVLAGIALLARPAPLQAQDSRELIRQGIAAYNDFEAELALGLLLRGVNPAIGPQDAVWAQGVQYLAQLFFDEGRGAQVQTWANWAARLNPNMTVDTLNLVSDVISAFKSALADVAVGPDDQRAVTSWMWVSGDPGSSPGRLQVNSGSVAANVMVVGRGQVPSAGLSLPAGSYQIQASAQGYRAVQVTREVLPGVTTVLDLNLAAAAVAEGVLSDAVRGAVMPQLAGLSVRRFGMDDRSCGAGALIGRDGLLVTTYQAIRGADGIEVTLGGARRFQEGVQVAAYDVGQDLAVLKIPLIRADSLTLASQVSNGQYTWGFGFPNCGSPAERRLQLAGAGDPLGLVDSLSGGVAGSPLINQQGALVGLWNTGLEAIPMRRAVSVIDRARQAVANRRLQTLAQVGDDENHAYGSIAITSNAAGAVARVRPLENWHWSGLEQTSFVPFTFSGPEGRYQLTLTVGGQVRQETQFTLRPSVADQLAVNIQVAEETPVGTPQIAQQRSGGGFPWIVAVLGVVGAGAAGAVLLLGGGDEPPGGNGPTTTGSILIRFRNP